MKKRFLMLFAAVFLVASAGLCVADDKDLAYFGFNEFPAMAASGIAAGDLVPVYDASTLKVKKVPADGVLNRTIRTATDAVANGQTSKTTTMTGVTSASLCFVSLAEVATNSVYLRASVPSSNSVVVTVSGDPGASNLDYSVLCAGP